MVKINIYYKNLLFDISYLLVSLILLAMFAGLSYLNLYFLIGFTLILILFIAIVIIFRKFIFSKVHITQNHIIITYRNEILSKYTWDMIHDVYKSYNGNNWIIVVQTTLKPLKIDYRKKIFTQIKSYLQQR